jgi:hypothetical protein
MISSNIDKNEILDNLISEGKRLTPTIYFVPAGPGVIRTFSVYSTTEKEKYQDWQSATQRFIKTYFPSDLGDMKEATKKINHSNHQKIMGILRAIKLMPEEPKANDKEGQGNTNITINNTQKVVLNLFTEAIKDEVTGKDYKILKDILKHYEREPEKTKSKLIDKLKSLGNDVLTNIIVNIMTNPNIYGGFF